MLTIEHLIKKCKKIVVIDDVSFNLEPKTIKVLLGFNRTGESTLMKSVLDFLKCDSLDNISNKQFIT